MSEGSSVLRYGRREGPAQHAHPDFTPLFLDEVPAARRREAGEVCGGDGDRACLYDFLASGSATFALRTKGARETALKDNADVSE